MGALNEDLGIKQGVGASGAASWDEIGSCAGLAGASSSHWAPRGPTSAGDVGAAPTWDA